MSRRFHYTQDEWLALAKAPTLVALAVMGTSATSPLQMVHELIGLGTALRQTAYTASAGALVHEINVETQAQLHELAQQPSPTIDLGGLRALALEACRRVATIVEAREPADQANEYKRWVLWLARKVAAAAAEGAEQTVSPDEGELLGELADALGARLHQAAFAELPVDPAREVGGAVPGAADTAAEPDTP